jgi:hypothetical protein
MYRVKHLRACSLNHASVCSDEQAGQDAFAAIGMSARSGANLQTQVQPRSDLHGFQFIFRKRMSHRKAAVHMA